MPDVEGRVARLEISVDTLIKALQELKAHLADVRSSQASDTAMLLGELRVLREDMHVRFQQVDARFQQIDNRFLQVDGRFLQIEARFEHVDQKIDRHFALLIGVEVATIGAFVSALLMLYGR
jgi:phosphatidylserine decarboxylase